MPKDGTGKLLTPREVLQRYPELSTKFYFTETDINKLVSHDVLWGHHEAGKRLWLINEDSIKFFIRYLNECLERKKIPPKD